MSGRKGEAVLLIILREWEETKTSLIGGGQPYPTTIRGRKKEEILPGNGRKGLG